MGTSVDDIIKSLPEDRQKKIEKLAAVYIEEHKAAKLAHKEHLEEEKEDE